LRAGSTETRFFVCFCFGQKKTFQSGCFQRPEEKVLSLVALKSKLLTTKLMKEVVIIDK
jgi:hypothetical protein